MEATKRGKEGSNDEVSSTKLPYLPQEVITEIFLRSHARSLGRFRCLSKSFRSLLSDPKFTQLHLDHNAVRSGHRILIFSCNNLFAVEFDSIRDGCEVIRDLTAVELDYPLKDDDKYLHELKLNTSVTFKSSHVYILGSSNGLVLLRMGTSENDVFLYNPTTGESKRLPDLPESLRSSSIETWFSYGFGFDSLNNDYKVIKFIDDDNYVYSLKKDSWRRICNVPNKGLRNLNSVELNGAIHWISIISGESQKKVMAFDLNTEKFRVIPLPDWTEECEHISGGVGTLKGRLCVVPWCYKMHDAIWVMNEYGVGSSWTKIRIDVSYNIMIPLCSTRNDEEVFLDIDEDLVLYNFERNTWRNVEIRVEFSWFRHVNTYVESLISPNSYGLQR